MFPIILSVFFPGLGQVLLSRYLRGLFFFFFTVIALDLLFIIFPFIVHPPAYIRQFSYAALLAVYFYNLWDIFNVVYFRHRSSLRRKKEVLLKSGLTYYLQNDLIWARNELKKALKLDKDDIDVLYYLSLVERASGNHDAEKRLLNKINILDFDEKWLKQQRD